MSSETFNFVGGDVGLWRVVDMKTVVGEPLEMVERLDVIIGSFNDSPKEYKWLLRGVTSNERYVTRTEKDALAARQPVLNRPEATRAALIPICKSAAWWNLAQDERRAILETKSKHIEIGLKYLPAIARRLHHCREIGEQFDFLTWFEYAPSDAEKFEELVNILRESEEWNFVDRETDIRLRRTSRE